MSFSTSILIGKSVCLKKKVALYTGKNLKFFDQLPSTNTYATQWLREGPQEGSVVQTGFQFEGKGQKGSCWEVAPGLNLTLSVIYYPTFLSVDRVFQLSKITALALYDTLEVLLPSSDLLIKWPNDLLVNKKKIAGILVENQLEGRQVRSSVIGIGLNVGQLTFPQALADKATSVRLEGGNSKLPTDLLFDALEGRYEELKKGKSEQIDRRYLRHLYAYQEEVEVEIKGREERAMLVGVGKDGRAALVIRERLAYFDIKEVRWKLFG